MTFRERFLNGEAEFDEIFDLTDEWNYSDITCTLREYLGLTAEEEDVWVSDSDEALEELMYREKTRRILFVDLDGTLLNDRKEVTSKTGKAIERFLKNGNIFVITTGRALKSALQIAEAFGLNKPGCYIICYNGSQIYSIDEEKMLCTRSVPREDALFCFEQANRFGIHIQTYSETSVLCEEDDEEIRKYCKVQHLPYETGKPISSLLTWDPPKLIAIDSEDPQRVLQFRAFLEPQLEGRLELCLSQKEYLEVIPKDVSKGEALTWLCRELCIPVTHSYAAGDAENDIEMLHAAGTGIAMKNGSESAKQAADRVTDTDNNHDGLVPLLEEIIRLQEQEMRSR